MFTVTTSTPASTTSTTSRPAGSYTTITTTYTTGSTYITYTSALPSGTVPGTVVVASPFPTFTCDGFSYLIQEETIYRINLTTGAHTVLNSSLGSDYGTVQSVGYNPQDNFIYGSVGSGNATRLIKISSLGTSYVGRLLNITNNARLGEIDQNGFYWLGTAVEDSGEVQWFQIDLRPGSATRLTTIASGQAALPGYNIYDWSYAPGYGNYLVRLLPHALLLYTPVIQTC